MSLMWDKCEASYVILSNLLIKVSYFCLNNVSKSFVYHVQIPDTVVNEYSSYLLDLMIHSRGYIMTKPLITKKNYQSVRTV